MKLNYVIRIISHFFATSSTTLAKNTIDHPVQYLFETTIVSSIS